MPEPESDTESDTASDSERDTLYPVSPTGDQYETLPPPFSSELQARLNEIGKQDVARH